MSDKDTNFLTEAYKRVVLREEYHDCYKDCKGLGGSHSECYDECKHLEEESYDAPGGRPTNRGMGSDGNDSGGGHDDVAFKSHAWNEHHLGHDLDAIQELVTFLRSEFEEGTHYKLHVGRGDDLPNTVSIHKQFQARESDERRLAELLDAASGPEAVIEASEDSRWTEEGLAELEPNELLEFIVEALPKFLQTQFNPEDYDEIKSKLFSAAALLNDPYGPGGQEYDAANRSDFDHR